IPKINDMFVAQCVVYAYGGRDADPPEGLRQDDSKPRLIDMSAAGRHLLRVCGLPRPDAQQLPPLESFMCGDPVALHAGKHFVLYPIGRGPQWLHTVPSSDRWQ